MKRKYLYASIVIMAALLFFKLFFEFFIGLERKHKYVPHIDTVFAKDFTPEKWSSVGVGDTITAVHAKLGHPLDSSYCKIPSAEPNYRYYEEYYSTDGKCEYGDFAWQSFAVYYNRELKVIALDSIWCYD